jgi:hypothetical protein
MAAKLLICGDAHRLRFTRPTAFAPVLGPKQFPRHTWCNTSSSPLLLLELPSLRYKLRWIAISLRLSCELTDLLYVGRLSAVSDLMS